MDEEEYKKIIKITEDETFKKSISNMISTFKTIDISGGGGVDGLALTAILRNSLKDNMTIVEIGSWKGVSTIFMGKEIANQGGKIFAVDIWKDKEIFNIFCHNIAILSLKDVVVPIRMISEKASIQFQDESIDFIFIDGDHSYEGFKKDILSWYPKVKIGGILCGHDCETYYDDLNLEQKQKVEEYKNFDSDPIGHSGVIKCMYDLFGRNFKILGVTWYLKKERKTL